MELKSAKKLIFSNFSTAKNHPGPYYSIAFYSPRSLRGFREFPLLCPEQDMLHAVKSGEMTRDEYKQRYNQLLIIRHSRIANVLERIPSGAVLCCYCDLKPEGSFCHRQLAAAYLEKYFSVEAQIE